MKKKRLLYLILPVITLILEILPYGAVCNFANPEGAPWRETFSYFDMTPFGYANFAPLITAIITCLIFGLLVVHCITGKQGWAVKAKNILYVGTVFSLGPLVFGINYFSIVGALITASLLAELLFLQFTLKPAETESVESGTN